MIVKLLVLRVDDQIGAVLCEHCIIFNYFTVYTACYQNYINLLHRKLVCFQSLRKHLLDELEQAFPEDVEQYREIRATSAAVSGNTVVLI